MKRGSIVFIAIAVVLVFLLCINSVLAYNGYGYPSFGGFSLAGLAENEWVNAGLLFLLLFTIFLFVLGRVFRENYSVVVIMSLVLAMMGALGVIYYYGVFLTQIAWWFVALVVAAILLGIWWHLRRMSNMLIFLLFVIALVWLLWLRSQVCGAATFFPYPLCIVLDAVFIIALIFVIIRLLMWAFNWVQQGGAGLGGGGIRWPGGGRGGGGGVGRPPRLPREPRAPREPGIGRLARFWTRRRQTPAQRARNRRALQVQKKYDGWIRAAQRKATIQTTEVGRNRYLRTVENLQKRRNMELRRLHGEIKTELTYERDKQARAREIASMFARAQGMVEKRISELQAQTQKRVNNIGRGMKIVERKARMYEKAKDVTEAKKLFKKLARIEGIRARTIAHNKAEIERLRKKIEHLHKVSERRIKKLRY